MWGNRRRIEAENETLKASLTEANKRIAELSGANRDYFLDKAYLDGMTTGWNLGDAGNSAEFNRITQARQKELNDFRRTELPQGLKP